MHQPEPHILITRPTGQHESFAHRLKALGFRVSHLPCLAIEPIIGQQLQADPADQADRALFTSTNAVINAHAMRPLPWQGMKVHAIGSATARLLISLGQTLASSPEPPFDSEAFTASLEAVEPARLLIIKGEGGRGVVAASLRDSGWRVSTLDVYRRSLPVIEASTVERIFRADTPHVVSVTSNEVLCNLVKLTTDVHPIVFDLLLLANSQRAVELAVTLGFRQPAMVADPAGDDGQLARLQVWLRDWMHQAR
jgi:uroporphyrinogen-III synthase